MLSSTGRDRTSQLGCTRSKHVDISAAINATEIVECCKLLQPNSLEAIVER